MSNVSKYNIFKGISTLLTTGTPIITLICCGDFFKHRSETALSAAGMFAILICMLFMKDKIAEYFKAPSAFIVSLVCLILIVIIEHIILPIKYVCFATIVTSGVDEITFKNIYKKLEVMFPNGFKQYSHLGFICAKQITLDKLENKNENS